MNRSHRLAVALLAALLVAVATDAQVCTDYDRQFRQTARLTFAHLDPNRVVAAGHLIVAAEAGGDYVVVDPTNAAAPAILATSSTSGYLFGLAGVPGYVYTASGTVWVLALDDPTHPNHVGTVPDVDSAIDVDVDGDLMAIAASSKGLAIADVSDPSAPVLLGVAATAREARCVALVGHHVLVGEPDGVEVFDVSTPSSPTLVGLIPLPGDRIQSVAADGARALAGGERMHVLDVADPAAASLVTSLNPSGGRGVVRGDRAYVDAYGLGAALVDLAAPAMVNSFMISGNAEDVAVVGDLMVVAAGSRGLHFVDAADVGEPAIIGFHPTPGNARGAALYGDVAYVANGWDGLEVLDVRDPIRPASLGVLPVADTAYDAALVGDHLMVADGDAGLAIYSVASPEHPVLVDRIDMTAETTLVEVWGNRLAVVMDSGEIAYFDVSDPAVPRLTGRRAFSAIPTDLSAAAGRFYVTTYAPMLMVFDADVEDAPVLLGWTVFVEGTAEGVAVVGDRAYVAAGELGLRTVDVSDPSPSMPAGTRVPTFGDARHVVRDGDRLLVADGVHGLDVVSLEDPATPQVIGSSGSLIYTDHVVLHERFAIVLAGYVGMEFLRLPCGDGDDGCTWDAPAWLPPNHGDRDEALAWGDLDDDGDPDAVAARASGPCLLFNEGGVLTASPAPLAGPGDWRDAAWADHDDDGDLDLFLARADGPDLLLDNEDGVLTDATTAPLDEPGASKAALWLDWNDDGLLDLYVVRADGPNRMFRNLGDGLFDAPDVGPLAHDGVGHAAAASDYDRDGDVDLYLVNEGPNTLVRNDDGDPVDAAIPLLEDEGLGRDAVWVDFDNDGDMDLHLVNAGSADRLFRNYGGGAFGIVSGSPVNDPGNGRTALWSDVDLDGDEDLLLGRRYEAPLSLRNTGGEFVPDVCGILSGLSDFQAVTSLGAVDVDRDGAPEAAISTNDAGDILLRPHPRPDRHWLRVRLGGYFGNARGVGARVRLFAGGRWQTREAGAGVPRSFGPGVLHFGLGDATVVDSLIVRWPGGWVDRLGDLPVDLGLTVLEGGTVPIEDPHAGPPPADLVTGLGENRPNPFNPGTHVLFTVATPGPMRIDVVDLAGRRLRTLVDAAMPRGTHTVYWDGRDENGRAAPSGAYLARMRTEEGDAAKAMLLLK